MEHSPTPLTDRIAAEVGAWEGVVAAPHPRVGTQFRLGRRELGHVHPERAADLPFPRRVRDELIAESRAIEHPFAPGTGWLRKPLATPEDAVAAIELFRLAYERARAAQAHAGASST